MVLHKAEEDWSKEPGAELRHNDRVDEVVAADPVNELVVDKLWHRILCPILSLQGEFISEGDSPKVSLWNTPAFILHITYLCSTTYLVE